jgi:TonB family protein
MQKKVMKSYWLAFLVITLPTISSARNDFWLGFRYSVSISFGAADLGKKNAPYPKSTPLPEYPSEMINAAVGGEVLLDYTVNPDGTVSALAVVGASAEEFRMSAMDAVRAWRFNPAIDWASGKPTSARMRCKVLFVNTEAERLDPAPQATQPQK